MSNANQAPTLQFTTASNDAQRALFNESTAEQHWIAYIYVGAATHMHEMRLPAMTGSPAMSYANIMDPTATGNNEHAVLRLHDHDDTADPAKSRLVEEEYLQHLNQFLQQCLTAQGEANRDVGSADSA